jgi:hypothetical protein
MSAAADTRSDRLGVYFRQVLGARRQVTTSGDAARFIEAICNQRDHTQCVEMILASPRAVEALRKAVKLDMAASFVNNYTANFLHYISDPLVKQQCNTHFLLRLLSIIADPPTLVNELVAHLDRQHLPESSVKAFGWLLRELLVLPPSTETEADFERIAQQLVDKGTFVTHMSRDVRTFGYKIEKLLRLRGSDSPDTHQTTAGGRHDNDFANFRQVAIIPTADELLSKERAFYRQAGALRGCDPSEHPAVHLDNQFRLLREDLLAELRLDVKVATGQTNVKRLVVTLQDLEFCGVRLGETRRRRPSGLKFRCKAGVPRLSQLGTAAERNTYLEDH